MEQVKLISRKELAKAIGVSVYTIINWNPPCYKAPKGAPRYCLEEVIQWMKENGKEK